MALNAGRRRSHLQDLGKEPAGLNNAQAGGQEGTNLSSDGNKAALHILRGFCAGAVIGITMERQPLGTNRQL